MGPKKSGLKAGKFVLSGTETNKAEGSEPSVLLKFKLKLKANGKVKGVKKFAPTGAGIFETEEQKCKVRGTWNENRIDWHYDFLWNTEGLDPSPYNDWVEFDGEGSKGEY